MTILALVLATPAPAGIEHTILHGVTVGRVKAWAGPHTLPGLSAETMRVAAESRLRAAGIRLDPAASSVLWIGATVMRGESGTCFVRVEAILSEEAILDRNGFRVTAESWRGPGVLTTTSVADCAGEVASAEDHSLADFVEHYQAMNPR
jgi:hypothetical protein